MGPFKTEEEMAEAACTRLTSQPGASNGAYGFEYCALHYYAQEDAAFFLSYLSDVGGTAAGGVKYCEIPRALLDVEHKDVVILGGAHTHPHNRQFSKKDMSTRAHWLPVRFVDPSTKRVWDRQLMMFVREKTGNAGLTFTTTQPASSRRFVKASGFPSLGPTMTMGMSRC